MHPYNPTSCSPTKSDNCPLPFPGPPLYPEGFEISDSLKDILVASVACGDTALEGMLRDNFDTIACISGVEACFKPNILLVRLQVGLTDYALDAARNLIDEFSSRGNGAGESHFRGSSYRDSEAQKQSQGTSFFKSRGNSFNNFTRTSESHESSFSTSRAQADGQFRNDGTDASYRQQNSTVVSFDDADVKGVGRGDGTSTYNSTRTSSASTRTSPNPSIPTIAPIPTPKLIFNIALPGAGIKYVAGNLFNPLPPVCGPSNADPDQAPTSCGAGLRPSVGAGFKSVWTGNATTNVTIPIPFVGVAHLGFNFSLMETESEHFRVQHVCSSGHSTVNAASTSNIQYQQQDDMVSNGETHLSGVGRDTHNIVRAGTSTRTSTSKLHAESTGRMDSCGESHSFSTRQAHGEAQNTGQSTSRSEGHSESENQFINRSKTISTSRYFNQIFKQLRQLRDILWTRLLSEEAGQRARNGPIASCAPKRQLTTQPLFWYANNMVCSGCYGRGCKSCGTGLGNNNPLSEFAHN